jgi:hypothetical protein
MSEFYGRIQGSRGEATRCGSKGSGIDAKAETWHSRLTAAFTPDGRGYFGIASKYGSDFLAAYFDADAVIENYDDDAVQDALRGLRDAFDRLDDAATKAADEGVPRRVAARMAR